MDIDILNWFINFIGVKNGENVFSTRMYNFWSGFGGNISILALVASILGIYRHNLKRLEKLNPLTYVHKKEKTDEPTEPK